jgi:hypothetical protein
MILIKSERLLNSFNTLISYNGIEIGDIIVISEEEKEINFIDRRAVMVTGFNKNNSIIYWKSTSLFGGIVYGGTFYNDIIKPYNNM